MKNKLLSKIFISIIIYSIVFCFGLLVPGESSAAWSARDTKKKTVTPALKPVFIEFGVYKAGKQRRYYLERGTVYALFHDGKTYGDIFYREPVTLVFNRAVSPSALKKHLRITDTGTGKTVPFQCRASTTRDKAVTIQFTRPLIPESRYKAVLMKNLPDRDKRGRMAGDVSFFFTTVPRFTCTLADPVVRAGQSRMVLVFSVPLLNIVPRDISIIRHGDGGSRELTFFTMKHDFEAGMRGKSKVRLDIYEPLKAGDRLTIRLKNSIKNLFRQPLRPIEIPIRVCGGIPAADFLNASGKPVLRLQNIKNLELDLLELTPRFMDFTQWTRSTASPGVLPGSLKQCVGRTKTVTLSPPGPTASARLFSLDRFDLFPGGGKFLGFKIKNAAFTDPCKLGTPPSAHIPESVFISHRRRHDFLITAAPDNAVVFAYHSPGPDSYHFRPLADAPVRVYRRAAKGENRVLYSGKTGSDGLRLIEKTLKTGDIVTVTHPATGDTAFYPLGLHKELRKKRDRYLIRLIIDRELYRPGDTVKLFAAVRKRDRFGKLTPVPSGKFRLTIESEKGRKSVLDTTVETDASGSFVYSFTTTPGMSKGYYDIVAEPTGLSYQIEYEEKGTCFFKLDYYQPDTFRLKFENIAPVYVFGKNHALKPVISGQFLSGNPMSGESLQYYLNIYPGLPHDFLSRHSLLDYKFRLPLEFSGEQVRLAKEVDLDLKGRCSPSLTGLDHIKYPAEITVAVTGKTKEGKEASEYFTSCWFPGQRVAGIRPPRYGKTGKPCTVGLAVIDPNGKLAAANADVTFFYIHPHQRQERMDGKRKMDAVRTIKKLRVKGKTQIAFVPPRPGSFLVKVDVVDDSGNRSITASEFEVKPAVHKRKTYLICKEYKDGFITGEDASFRLFSNRNGRALITLEKGKIIDARVVEFDDSPDGTPVNFKIKPSYFPYVRLNIRGFTDDGSRVFNSKQIYVSSPRHQLQVSLTPAANEITPDSESHADIRVTDPGKKGKKARVLVYAVDEGALLLTRYEVPYLFTHMYHDSHWHMDIDTLERDSRYHRLLRVAPSGALDFISPSPSLKGKVTGPDRKPLAGARVIAVFSLPNKKKPRITRSLFTCEDGTFDFGPAPSYIERFTVAKQGFEPFVRNYHSLNEIPKIISLNPAKSLSASKKHPGTKAAGKGSGSHFIIKRSLPVKLGGPRIQGIVALKDGSRVPGVYIALSLYGTGKHAHTVSDKSGVFRFSSLPHGIYSLDARLAGFKIVKRKNFHIGHKGAYFEIIMESVHLTETITISRETPVIDVNKTQLAAALIRVKYEERLSLDKSMENINFSALLRKDFKQTLFFKVVETDENGFVRVPFRSAQSLSTYRIMAVALTADCFGYAQKHIRVSQPLVLEEAVPEFLLAGDRLTAGVRVGNRTNEALKVSVQNKPAKGIIAIKHGKTGKRTAFIKIPSKQNKWVWFDLEAKEPGTEAVHFYALGQAPGSPGSREYKDALLKKIPVYPRYIEEFILEISTGKQLKKTIQPRADVRDQTLLAEASPVLVHPAAKIRERLSAYPYGCLEQRTSRISPWLILSPRFLELTIQNDKHRVSTDKVKEWVKQYADFIRHYEHPNGGLCYYKGSSRVSGYLTVYVYWTLRMAQERFPDLDFSYGKKLRNQLEIRDLKPVPLCFFQYVKSLDRQADPALLEKLFQNRHTLPLMARVFLYRAIYNSKLPNMEKILPVMTNEFKKLLVTDGESVYFEAGKRTDAAEFPFYSTRFLTAFMLRAFLEVDKEAVPAHRIMQWLLRADPAQWTGTQTNAWILFAADAYYRAFQNKAKSHAVLTLDGSTAKKTFTPGSRDSLKLEKSLQKTKKPLDVTLQADRPFYLTTRMQYKIVNPPPASRGIHVQRNIYNEKGQPLKLPKDKIPISLKKGKRYMVELLITPETSVPYGVIDEPLAAGFEVLRQDFATSVKLKPFSKANSGIHTPWYWPDHAPGRIVFYSYTINGKIRILYYIKAMYRGTFTWMPTVVQGMYDPNIYGRNGTCKVEVY